MTKTETMQQGESKEVPPEVKNSTFGCKNCLWMCIECKDGSLYKPKGKRSCEAYTYYD